MKRLRENFVEPLRQTGSAICKARCVKLYMYRKNKFLVELSPYTDRGQRDTFDTREPPPKGKSKDDYSPIRA